MKLGRQEGKGSAKEGRNEGRNVKEGREGKCWVRKEESLKKQGEG